MIAQRQTPSARTRGFIGGGYKPDSQECNTLPTNRHTRGSRVLEPGVRISGSSSRGHLIVSDSRSRASVLQHTRPATDSAMSISKSQTTTEIETETEPTADYFDSIPRCPDCDTVLPSTRQLVDGAWECPQCRGISQTWEVFGL